MHKISVTNRKHFLLVQHRHQNGISSSCLPGNTQCLSRSVFGRLVSSKPMQKKFDSRPRGMLESSWNTRFQNQQKEILSVPLSINCSSGSFVSVHTKIDTSISKQNIKFVHTTKMLMHGQKTVRYLSSSMVRNSFLVYRSNSKCKSIYETF